MKPLHVTGLMLRIPKVLIMFTIASVSLLILNLLQKLTNVRQNQNQFHEKRLRNGCIKNLVFSLIIYSCQPILAQFPAPIIILQTINLFKLPLIEVRGSQEMLCPTVPVGVSDLTQGVQPPDLAGSPVLLNYQVITASRGQQFCPN